MDSKIRIYQLLEATLGGTRKYIVDLLTRLDLDRFEVLFGYATGRSDPMFRDALALLAERGIGLQELPMCREPSPWRDMLALGQIVRTVRRWQPDIIHCHSAKAGFLGRLSGALTGRSATAIYTPHGLSTHVGRQYWWAERVAARWTDYTVAVSDSEFEDLSDEGLYDPGALRVIPLGLDCELDEERSWDLRESRGIGSDEVVVASVGFLSDVKNPMGLLRAARAVLEQSRSVHFCFIGEGPLRARMEEYIAANGMGANCHLLGWQNGAARLLWTCDIFALTSKYESFGYVTCEAMLRGLPVVGTDVMGSRSIIRDGVTGFLVRPDAWDTLAKRILELAERPALREQMGRAGAARVRERFDVRRMVKDTADLYFAAVGGGGTRVADAGPG